MSTTTSTRYELAQIVGGPSEDQMFTSLRRKSMDASQEVRSSRYVFFVFDVELMTLAFGQDKHPLNRIFKHGIYDHRHGDLRLSDVTIDMVERECGSGDSWNICITHALSGLKLAGHYNSKRRKGSMKIIN